jgi:rod shape-determining protein MreC
VQPFSPVLTADGLVGMVQSADANTSYAITWAHPDFAVSAMSVDEAAFGIVQPHLGIGPDRWLLELRGVSFRAKLDTGTLIVSSGLGGTYPRGIPVGVVISEISTPEKWARTYLLRPAVLPKMIGPVIVMLPPRSARGVNKVWTNVASADSAAKAIATAGDSITADDSTRKKAALDELAARRAVLDSAAQGTVTPGSAAVTPGATVVPPTTRRPVTRADSLRADSVRAARARQDTARPRPTGPPPPRPTGPPPEAQR